MSLEQVEKNIDIREITTITTRAYIWSNSQSHACTHNLKELPQFPVKHAEAVNSITRDQCIQQPLTYQVLRKKSFLIILCDLGIRKYDSFTWYADKTFHKLYSSLYSVWPNEVCEDLSIKWVNPRWPPDSFLATRCKSLLSAWPQMGMKIIFCGTFPTCLGGGWLNRLASHV